VKEDDLKWWCKDFVRAYKARAAGIDAGFFLPAGSTLGVLAQKAIGEWGMIKKSVKYL